MPAVDPPGTLKHIRFGKISPEIYEALVGIPGVKSVVLHKYGKKGEHPHWHVWWEGDEPITNQTWRNRAHKLPALSTLKGNPDWSIRNHDSWEAWSTYVTTNLSHEVLLPYKDIETISAQAKVITLASPVTPVIPGPTKKAVKSESRMRWDERICYDAETRLGWKRDSQFSLESLYDHSVDTFGKIERQVFAFMRGRVNNYEAVKYTRNLLYEFGDDDVKDYLQRKVFEKISWC